MTFNLWYCGSHNNSYCENTLGITSTHKHYIYTDQPRWESWGETPARRARWSSGRSPVYGPPPGSAQNHGSPFPTAAPGSLVCRLEERGRKEGRKDSVAWTKICTTINHSLARCSFPCHRHTKICCKQMYCVWEAKNRHKNISAVGGRMLQKSAEVFSSSSSQAVTSCNFSFMSLKLLME